MHHIDPTFRALLLDLAADPPDLRALGELADWLEERGDPRAGKVRAESLPGSIDEFRVVSREIAHAQLLRDGELNSGKVLEGVEEVLFRRLTRRVLALFLEGPRWRCPVSINHKPLNSELSLTFAEASARAPIVELGGRRFKIAPQLFWPEPPA